MATALTPGAFEAPPMATDSLPLAVESTCVELTWKYLMPPPFTMLFTVLLMLLTLLLILPSAVSTVPNAEPTSVAAPLVPSIEFAFTSA
jgi:hypothetical protein